MLPSDYERILKDEIWGMFKHIGIPIETVMSMPIQDRRYYIQKHNYEQEANSAAKTESKNIIETHIIFHIKKLFNLYLMKRIISVK